MRYKLDPLSPFGISSINTTIVSAGGTSTTTSSGGVQTVVAGNNIDVDATDPSNPIVAVETLTLADISDVTASATEVNYTDGVTSAIQTQLDGKPNVTVTGEGYLTLSTQQITANPIDLDNLSATGTPSGSTFLRGDNTWATPAGSGDVSKVGTPVDNQVGVWTGDGTIEGDANLTFDTTTDTLSTVNIAPSGTVDGRDVATDGTKLDGIEAGADVTDATNVNAAGATMNSDTSLVGNGYFLDEDNMASNDATKVPSQQSVKAYVDAVNVGTVDSVVAGNNIDVDATDPANPIVSVETLTLSDISDVTASVTEVNYTDGVTSAIQTQLDGKQPLDSDLTTIAGLTATTDNVIQSVGSAWASRTPAQLKTTLALAKGDVGLGNVDNTSDATKKADIIGTIYPVGSLYTSTLSTNPGTLLGVGTWVAFGEGRVMVGKAASGTFGTAGATGGSETHTLSATEMPAHTHDNTYIDGNTSFPVAATGGTSQTGARVSVGAIVGSFTGYRLSTASKGGGGAHNNLQPYIVVYMWERTA